MSSTEGRHELTARLMLKLLKSIGIKDDFNRFEQQAWSIIRKHRGISTNRHEVRRRIDDMKEKFEFDNLKECADHLETLCSAVIENPVCLQSTEVDVQYSLINFLIDIAYKPTVAFRKAPHEFIFGSADLNANDNLDEFEDFEIKALLKEDFIPVTNYKENDSDLSDWSDGENVEENLEKATKSLLIPTQPTSISKPVVILPHLSALKPPVKQLPFCLKVPHSDIKHQLNEKIQNSWWLRKECYSAEKSTSHSVVGNFAILLNGLLPQHLLKYDRFRDPILIEEFCFMRELLWMFYAPQSCQAFVVEGGEIKLRTGVTMASVSAPTLASYLEHQILPYANQINIIRSFINSVNAFQSHRLPITYDFYAANIKSLLDPITSKIVEYEGRIVEQRNFEINTLITMRSVLKESFKKIEVLHAIHKAVSLDYQKLPPHIISSYLLAALMQFSNDASRPIESNLSISLFLTSIKAFCGIIDSWWNEGRLDDWQEEFVVECSPEQSISLRMFSKNKKKAFFVPKNISDVIGENEFVQLLLAHSLEVGHTLNLLYEICRIGDLRNDCKAIASNLYDSFVEDVLRHVRTLGVKKETTIEDVVDTQQRQAKKNISVRLTTKDEFLLMLFDSKDQSEAEFSENDVIDAKVIDTNALDIYQELSQYEQILPYEEIILKSFNKILRERTALANMFVVKLYREEFKILTHLRNVRKVLLLEADDLMLSFYGKLFEQIQAGKPWANAFVLTMQLDDILSSKFPEMSSHFRCAVNTEKGTKTTKVTEAVETFSINYNLSNELVKIITEDDMKVYNEIFRFLLQIKWGLMTLENMPFARVNRPLYASIDMVQFAMRRLENIRFWMISAMQWLASHLLMLQVMGGDLDAQLQQCKTVREMKAVHKSYLATISQHCFLSENLKGTLTGIEQLLNLVLVLQSDHQAALQQLNKCDPLSLDDSGGGGLNSELENENYSFTAHINEVEVTYIRIHEYLANMLKNEVYINQHTFLSCLSAAFNTSMPY